MTLPALLAFGAACRNNFEQF